MSIIFNYSIKLINIQLIILYNVLKNIMKYKIKLCFLLIMVVLLNTFLQTNAYCEDFLDTFKHEESNDKLSENPNQKKIGMLFDGPYWWNEKMVKQIKFELKNLNMGEFNIIYPENCIKDGNYDVDNIEKNAFELAANKELALILCFGTQSTKVFTNMKNLKTPTVAIGVDFPTVTGILDPKSYQPVNPNITMVYDPGIETSYTNFIYKLTNFNKISFLCSDFLLKNNPVIKTIVTDILKMSSKKAIQKSESEVIEISPSNFEEKVAGINTDVIIIGRLCGFNDSDVKKLFNAINEKKIPTITTDGLYGANNGALASLSDYDFKHIGRKYALKVYNILTGLKPSELSVIDNWKLELIFNQETARKIGYDIPLEFLYDAKIVGTGETKMSITLKKALEIVLTKDYDIISKKYDIEKARHQFQMVKGGYLPNIDSNINCLKIDNTRADLQPGSRIQSQIEFSLFQNIYNPELNQSIKLSDLEIKALKQDQDLYKQDLIQAIMISYLNYMLAEDNLMVRKEQLRILRKHKDIATLRYELEEISKSDVLRLEIQYDQGRMELVKAHDHLNIARVNLANLLNISEDTFFQMDDRYEYSPEAFKKRTSIFQKYYKTRNRLNIFQKFLIAKAYENSIELKILNTRINQAKVQEQKIYAKFLPFMNFGASWFHKLHSEHRNLEVKSLPLPVNIIPDPNDPSNYLLATQNIVIQNEDEIYNDSTETGWQAFIKLNCPIYSGGTRFKELEIIKTELKKLEVQKEKLLANLAKNIKILYHEHYTSRNNASIAIQDVELARENLKLGETAYMQGGLAIIDLLNIQSSLIQSEINATYIRYDHLKSVVNLLRSISMTELFAEPEDSPTIKILMDVLEAYFKENLENF